MTKLYHDSKRRPPIDIEHEAIGNRMRELRIARKLSLRDVEALGGPCVATLVLAESGLVSVNINTLKSLADVLGVRLTEFVLRKDADVDEICALVNGLPKKSVQKLLSQLKRKVLN